jgi:phage terminase small subunit
MSEKQSSLTPRQKAFCDEYLISFNATDAARKAGYKDNGRTLRSTAHENLTKPDIIAYLASRTQKIVAKREKRLINVYEQFEESLEFCLKLKRACERWLKDHEADGDEFTIEPRASEVKIIWTERIDGKPQQKTEQLDILLARLEEEGDIPFPAPYIKTTDLREFALKTIDRIDMTLDKFAKMGGDYTKEKANPADSLSTAKKVVQELMAQGKTPQEAARFAAGRYGVLEDDLIRA